VADFDRFDAGFASVFSAAFVSLIALASRRSRARRK
jgi:hypothetical protein